MMAHHWVKYCTSLDTPLPLNRDGKGRVQTSTAPDSDLPRQQDYDEEETGDSKSMRMTLMEEVLLLGLKDIEVR